jgi:hypothetical protein
VRAQESGSANGADADLCARAKADLASARITLKEATDAETARITRFEEERVKRERKVCGLLVGAVGGRCCHAEPSCLSVCPPGKARRSCRKEEIVSL